MGILFPWQQIGQLYGAILYATLTDRIMAAAVPSLGWYFKVNECVEEDADSGVGVKRGE